MGAVELILVRHGESEGNIAATEADATKADRVPVPARDADVLLSPIGRQQAEALGRHLAELPPDEAPESLWVSPYRRAQETAELIRGASGLRLDPRLDERLRDRELGVLDALTWRGVNRYHPEEAQRRKWLGKLYYRPPGGESWADVALRVRTLLADLDREEDGRRVLVVCHDAVISLFRFVCERLDEATLLEDALLRPIANGSITRLARPTGTGVWRADLVGDTTHLAERAAPVTEHRGQPVVPGESIVPGEHSVP